MEGYLIKSNASASSWKKRYERLTACPSGLVARSFAPRARADSVRASRARSCFVRGMHRCSFFVLTLDKKLQYFSNAKKAKQEKGKKPKGELDVSRARCG